MSNGLFNQDQLDHMRYMAEKQIAWRARHQERGHTVSIAPNGGGYAGVLCSCGVGWNYWDGCEVSSAKSSQDTMPQEKP